MGKRFDVKPTSANNDRQLISRMNLINRPRSDAPEFLCVHIFVKWYYADQMMGRFRERRSIRFCRQEIEPVINLKRIRADNLRADFPCDIGRQLGLSGRGGTDDKKNSFHKTKL